ncbi:MAG: hypothetical protein LBN36_06220 [Clostridiales Family XIII bacterium]|jgi:hypothetical protein|nr:hypothetical protein [Clostridiales Family XIII bacterium]
MGKETLKTRYGLEPDPFSDPTALVRWYNNVIDKSVDELDVSDVSRMLRQNLLPDVALARAIELFLENPLDGEILEGDLVELLAAHRTEIAESSHVRSLAAFILKVEAEMDSFDWCDEDDRIQFEDHLRMLKQACSASKK